MVTPGRGSNTIEKASRAPSSVIEPSALRFDVAASHAVGGRVG